MPVHMLHVLSMYARSLCLKKCWTGMEAIEVETLTQNNVAVPLLPASGETSTELCSLWKHHRNKPYKLRFHFQLITLLCHEFRKICEASKSRNKASSPPPRANFLQTLSLFLFACTCVCLSSLFVIPRFSLSLPLSLFLIISCLLCLSLPTCLSLAKSLQEFAAVLQNLEDERTRMVSDLTYCKEYYSIGGWWEGVETVYCI